MPAHLLAALTEAGILERTGARGRRFLRVTPRFLAHADAARHRAHAATPRAALEAALSTWDGYGHDVRRGASFLGEFLAERDQLGPLRPVFPALESFHQGAAASA